MPLTTVGRISYREKWQNYYLNSSPQEKRYVLIPTEFCHRKTSEIVYWQNYNLLVVLRQLQIKTNGIWLLALSLPSLKLLEGVLNKCVVHCLFVIRSTIMYAHSQWHTLSFNKSLWFLVVIPGLYSTGLLSSNHDHTEEKHSVKIINLYKY